MTQKEILDFEERNVGVIRQYLEGIRVTTYPFVHRRTFDSDVIGNALYMPFLRLNDAG